MSFYQQLQDETQHDRERLFNIAVIRNALAGDISLPIYTAFLTQAYHHVKHTLPLLMATGSRLPASQEWLREAVATYIEEETGHQEWILNDIAACGSDKEAVRHGRSEKDRPTLATELMVSYAWDMVQRVNPLGFFGMVQVLEGTSVAIATQAARAIQQSLGLPDQAFSYLLSHGSLDQEHLVFFENLINRLDSTEDQRAIVHAAKVFYQLYGNIFRTLPNAQSTIGGNPA